MHTRILGLFMLMAALLSASAADGDGFVPLFNGRDLKGWINVNCAPETWSVSNGIIHCTGHPTGALRTPRHYENFILELEWRHLSKGGNSGVFIWATPIAAPAVPFLRGVEVQVLDTAYAELFEKETGKKSEWFTTHGDVFPIHGATMKPFGRHAGERSFPSEDRSKSSPEWNHYRVVCDRGVLRLSVNGKEVSGGEDCNYRKGYLGLESEGAPVEYRNIRIKELPSSNTPASLTAPIDSGLRSIFTGLDLRGWKTNEVTARRWSVRGEHIQLASGAPEEGATLWTETKYGEAEFVFDCRPAKEGEGKPASIPVVSVRGMDVRLTDAIPGKSQRYNLVVSKGQIVLKRGDVELQRVALPGDAAARAPFGWRDSGAGIELMNLYARGL